MPAEVGRNLGFEKLTDKLHGKWLQWFIFGKDDEGLLLAHRGSYKTTCLALAMAFIVLLFPAKRIIFVRKTDADVKEVIELVARIAATKQYKELGKRLWGVELRDTVSTQTEFSLNIKQGLAGSPQLLGLGTSTSITGKHCDILFYDDIVNKKDRVSKAEREAIKFLYYEFFNVLNPGGRLIGTGTPWHKDDAYSLVAKEKVHYYDCHTTGILSKEQIAKKRQDMPPSLFAANYELKHIADTDALFKMSPRHFDAETKLYNCIFHIDAAYGGKDRTALTAIKEVEGKFYAMGKVWDKHVDDCLGEIKELHTLLRAGTVHCETNADKGYLRKELRARGMPSKGYHESTNKYVKISTLGLKAWRKTRWLYNTDDDYLLEILDYTETAEHDDCPDSFATAVRCCTKGEVKVQLMKEGF